MKKIIVSLVAGAMSFGLAQVASAADMPVKGRAPAPVYSYNWSGFYVGGSAGWQSSSIGLSRPSPAPAGTVAYDPDHSSFLGGFFLGYQQQFGQLVLGVEGGWQTATGSETFATPALSIFFPGGTGSANASVRDIWNVGARAGLAMGMWMPYITGGYANGAFRFNAASTGVTQSASTRTGGGYFGVGLDWAFTPQWILGVEYRHYAFSDKTVAANFSTGGLENVNFDPRTNAVVGRLSYKFGN